MTPVEEQRLAAYRACDRIRPVLDRDEAYRQFDVMRCANDHLPVIRRRNGTWRHDPSAIAELARKERGER